MAGQVGLPPEPPKSSVCETPECLYRFHGMTPSCMRICTVSDFVIEGTPVPIPNTVVKLNYADNT